MKTIFSLVMLFVFSGLMLAQNPDTSLVAFYPFSGNANDLSGNNNNGTVSGASLTQDRFGFNNMAYSFNGTDNYITIADNPNLFSDELTISWWYKMTEILGGERVVIGWVDGGHRYQQFFNGDQISYLNGYNVAQPGMYFNPIYGLNDLDVWKNVVVTYQKTGASTSTTSIYVDGELKQTDNHTLAMDYVPGINLFIGKNHNGNFFKGDLDDIRIYTRILDSNEIVALFNDTTNYILPSVYSVYPHQNSSYFLPDETINVFITEALDPATVNSSSVFVKGNLTGWYTIDPVYSSSNNSIEITPVDPFKVGEEITVSITNEILNISGDMIEPFVFTFKVKPKKGSVKFAVADSLQLDFTPTQVISADLNNDGLVDVVVGSYDSAKVVVAFNQGNGSFIANTLISGDFKPSQCAISDIDNNLGVDLIFSAPDQHKIYFYKNDGAGYFVYFDDIDVNAVAVVCPGDFDGGGNTDLVALTNTPKAITYKNNGQGFYTEYSSIDISGAPLRTIVGDIDNDGDMDVLAGTSDYWGTFKILRNNGYGDFSFVGGPYLGPYPDELAGGDFDGDYDLDFVKCAWYQNGLGIAINNGTGDYLESEFFNLGNVGGQTRNPIVEDFDGDGDLDFVGVFNNNNIGIVKNNIHPSYELSLSYSIPGLRGIAAGDFDNNGSVDLVGINSASNKIMFIRNCLDSLVAYYPFNGNPNDAAGNSNNGINYAGVFSKDRYGNDNASMFFNAVDSYVEGINPGNNLPVGNSSRSFSAWIKNYQYNQWGSNIFHYGTQQAAPTNFHFLITDVLGLGNGYGYGVVYGNTNLIDSTWHFVTGVYEGGTERTTKLYIDGELDVTGAITTEPNTVLTNNWRVGRFMEGSSNFNGNIDELKVYDIPLTNQQVQDMYKATTTAPTLLFPLDDSTLINPIMLNLVLDWDSLVTATGYRFLLANDSLFNTVIHDTLVNTSSFNFYDWFAVNIDNLYWKVRTINDGGIGPWSEINHFSFLFTDIKDEIQLPTEFALMQNYPNPFNPTTTITYHLPKTANVELKVYDVIGNEIATLVNEEKSAGVYNVQFAMNNLHAGRQGLSSGIYFYQLKAGDFVQTKKMIFIK